VTTYGYEVAGRLTAVTNANSEVVRYIYDAAGNVTQLVDAKNQANKFAYDLYGRLTNQIDAGNIVLTNSIIELLSDSTGRNVEKRQSG
jgi:YD repeat-containing protein